MRMIRKYHNQTLQTNPRHREEEQYNNHKAPGRQSKATSFLYPIKIIVKLERTLTNVQQNMEQTQNPTTGATTNNESTTEPPP